MTAASHVSAQHQHNTSSHSLIGRLFHFAETNPDHDAVVTPNFTLSYAQLAQLVQAQALIFNDTTIKDSSVIGIKCADDTQHLLLCLAATYVGATSCTISSHETTLTQKAMISRCGVTHVVDESIAIDSTNLNTNIGNCTVSSAPMARLLFSTSGTTGEPKLVIHHDCDLVSQAHRHISSIQERFTCLATMEHNFAKRHRLYCVAVGATNIFLDAEQQSLVNQCKILDVNVMHVSAFQAQELLAAPHINSLSNIRLKLGGSHVALTLRQQLRNNITLNLQAGYGTTETGAIAFTDPNDSNAGESVGQVLPGIEVRTVSPERKPLSTGERGELAIRCNGMFRGYNENSNLTSSRLEDGWFYTGDIGYLDKQQRIHLCGRSDDMFVFNSMNIYPQDIESQICQHPDIIDAAVLPKTSSVHNNIPVALVVFAEGVKPDLEKLKKFVRERAGVRSPRQFTIVDDIPRNASGKISRREIANLSYESNQIRHSIIQALKDSSATNNLNPSLIAAFENGDKDITLREIGLTSLARMELLIVLETEYDTVIMPEKFSHFRTLDEFASCVLTPPPHGKLKQDCPTQDRTTHAPFNTISPPYVVRFFQRIFRYCHTVAQLNKALLSLEQRLTPTQMKLLYDWHQCCQLVSTDTAEKFQTALSHWINNMQRMMLDSGKSQPEPFVAHKITPTVAHFCCPGTTKDKTLIICFSARGSHRLMMPNTVLMQHTDAAHYDLMIISEPSNKGYHLGVAPLGKNVIEIIEWLNKLNLISNYAHIRTMGCSAGSYPAILAGYLLKAEIAVSVGGRFPSERHPIRILNMMLTTLQVKYKGHCSSVLMSFATDKNRDRNFSRIMSRLCRGNTIAVEITDEKVGHGVFERLVERGELAPYLARTIFANMNDELITSKRKNTIMNFPTTLIRPYGTQRNHQ